MWSKYSMGSSRVAQWTNSLTLFENTVGTVRRENPEIPESYYIKSFVAGLRDYEQHHTQIQKPSSLIEAYWIARRLESSNPVKKHATTTWSQRPAYRPVHKEMQKQTLWQSHPNPIPL
jgi:hypothetical protein